MPRPALPPTPASSTDIEGKDGTKKLASLQLAFELPPPAIARDPSSISPTDMRTSPPSLPSASSGRASYPMQVAEAVKSRRRASSTAQKPAAKEAFTLPPPPTRSRKIIQMKPKQEEPEEDSPSAKNTTASKAAASNGTAAATSKKKQPSATSAAGRKIARKTAHSLIERRRRSKMNEEFAVLKGMIPACTGEMHKLAILQASIEYVRYLEDCVSKLKEQREAPDMQTPTEGGRDLWASIPQFAPTYREDPSGDVEMTGSEAASPPFAAQPSRSHQPSVSPALLAEDARNRNHSYSSTSTDHRHYSYSASSATTSPAFGPQICDYGRAGGPSQPPSALTSPALAPQREHRDLDQEATAALLMLNSDRRGTIGSGHGRSSATESQGTGRGMSVRDLLSA
ncbi:hypothetical protein D7B24_000088 [Verticillium nonalfalfae]|uniref:BHLH domain-containing protein n=1 Tax=Verticillium nonalfalfae TaxID=1051616 RepID=A0A3M9YLV1_9PEZI|nr:uncharacterized protein D7B24_000088 [Verticillium nonalfalfae]RNJ61235.1 hypothetical protein D7B24_000088 [Verticillium nonalfalfae]